MLLNFTEFASFRANYITVVEVRPILSPDKCVCQTLVFSNKLSRS